jgi:hypothetical protein
MNGIFNEKKIFLMLAAQNLLFFLFLAFLSLSLSLIRAL